LVGRRSGIERRTFTSPDIPKECELRDDQDRSSDVSRRQVHLPILIVEDPEPDNLLCQIVSIFFAVAVIADVDPVTASS
jgi:hypothetical protein